MQRFGIKILDGEDWTSKDRIYALAAAQLYQQEKSREETTKSVKKLLKNLKKDGLLSDRYRGLTEAKKQVFGSSVMEVE